MHLVDGVNVLYLNAICFKQSLNTFIDAVHLCHGGHEDPGQLKEGITLTTMKPKKRVYFHSNQKSKCIMNYLNVYGY